MVIDDAHAALVTADAQCTATIPAELDAYHELLELFRRDLEQQSSEALMDIETKAPGGVGRGAVLRSRRMNNAATASPAHAPMLGSVYRAKELAAANPRVKLHVVCDTHATHTPEVNAWLARNP